MTAPDRVHEVAAALEPTPPPVADRLRYEVLTDPAAVEALLPEWRALAREAAATAFESPDWLHPWWATYGEGGQPVVHTWRRAGRLVGIAPLVRSRRKVAGRPLVDIGFWSCSRVSFPPYGLVDAVALPSDSALVVDALSDWLAEDEDWQLMHLLRLPNGSPTGAALREASKVAGWRREELGGVVDGTSWVIDLPADLDGWQRHLGNKARRNMRREVRLAEEAGVRTELVTDAARVPAVLDDVERLMRARWSGGENFFSRDPRYRPFLERALTAMVTEGSAYAHVAADNGAQACLVTLNLNGHATALVLGVTTDARCAPFSLGKNLFDRSIAEAVARGCTTYDFLWAGGYKQEFWHARPQSTDSVTFGRGALATAVLLRARLRRLVPNRWRLAAWRLRRRLRGGRRAGVQAGDG